MSDYIPSPEFDEKLRVALTVPAPEPAFVSQLRAKLIARSAEMKSQPKRFFLRPAWRIAMAVLLVLIVTVLLIGPQNVVAAMQKLLGYIPGVGVVDRSVPIRVLSEPVTAERDGYTMTVESGVLDSQRTVVTYSVEGISLATANAGGEGAENPKCSPFLLLPDGTTLGITGGRGDGWGTGYRDRMIFPSLPMDVNKAAFVVPCVRDMPPGSAPENWQFQLRFQPAPPDMTVMPVIDITPSPSATDAGNGSGITTPFGIGVVLEKVIPTEDGYILTGRIISNDARFTASSDVVKVFDATGQEVPSENVDLYSLGTETGEISPQQWGIRVQGHSFVAPLEVRAVSVIAQLATPLSVPFDPGANPQEGQEWQMSQTLDVLGYPVRMISARYLVSGDMHGFEFTIQMPAGMEAPSFGLDGIVGGDKGGDGGGPADENGIERFTTITNGSFGGPLVLTLHSVFLKGSWQVAWTPPASGDENTPISVPQACLTLDGWKQIQAGSPVPLPAGLTGTLLTMRGALAPEPSLFLSALDGSGTRPLVFGNGSLSPNGTRIVYSDAPGAIHILDLATGTDTTLNPAVVGVRQVAWSPDGQFIAYDRFTDGYNVYVMNADGSNLHQLTSLPGMQFLEGWTLSTQS
jgi:hypothetical protein